MSKPLGVNIAGIKMKNPVIAASGTFGFGKEYGEYIDLNLIGGISVKGLTLKPRQGNPPPRISETASGILNSVGLQNPGIDSFIKDELPFLEKIDIAVIANIAGSTIEEFCIMAKKLQSTSVAGIELNVSCPNVKEGGIAFGKSKESVYDVTREVRKCTSKPLIVKLSPNVSDIGEIAQAAEKGGADAISLINTLLGMAVDIKCRKPVLKNVTGGLSGPAVKPIALRMVYEVYNRVSIPIIGMGGIMNWEDAVEFMLVGASAVSVGTANLISPYAIKDIIDGLENYLKNTGEDYKEIVGKLII